MALPYRNGFTNVKTSSKVTPDFKVLGETWQFPSKSVDATPPVVDNIASGKRYTHM